MAGHWCVPARDVDAAPDVRHEFNQCSPDPSLGADLNRLTLPALRPHSIAIFILPIPRMSTHAHHTEKVHGANFSIVVKENGAGGAAVCFAKRSGVIGWWGGGGRGGDVNSQHEAGPAVGQNTPKIEDFYSVQSQGLLEPLAVAGQSVFAAIRRRTKSTSSHASPTSPNDCPSRDCTAAHDGAAALGQPSPAPAPAPVPAPPLPPPPSTPMQPVQRTRLTSIRSMDTGTMGTTMTLMKSRTTTMISIEGTRLGLRPRRMGRSLVEVERINRASTHSLGCTTKSGWRSTMDPVLLTLSRTNS
eukprot:m.228454 g.228454  ORF g.228454 m.228454 type:complete len:301 (-) comp25975_c1_seq9:1331-2233(-)